MTVKTPERFTVETRDEEGTVTVCELSFTEAGRVAEPRVTRRLDAAVGPLKLAAKRYDPMAVVGKGGFAYVLRADDRRLGRTVAVKKGLRAEGQADLLREGLLAARLQHPNIVPVYDVEYDDDGVAFYTMKLLVGRSLKEVLLDLRHRDSRTVAEFPLTRLLSDFRSICLATHYAHSQGVIHRDIKPANIVIGEFGEVVLADWGIAARLDELSEPSGVLRGTVQYLAPERLRDQPEGSVASDVYALGATLHEILTYEPPLVGTTLEVLEKLWRDEPRTQRLERAGLPGDLVQLCLQALETDPALRPASAEKIAAAVTAHLDREAERELRALRAAELFEQAERGLRSYRQTAEQIERERASLELAESRLEATASRDARRTIWGAREEVNRKRVDLEAGFARLVRTLESVLQEERSHGPARDCLSELYWERFEEAERDGEQAWAAFFEQLVRKYDTGAFARRFEARSAVTIGSQTAPFAINLSRYQEFGPLLEPSPVERRTAMQSHAFELRPGSYLAEIEAPGFESCRLPFVVVRGEDLSISFALYRPEQVPSGMVVVLSDVGDFAIDRFPVTVGGYLDYVNRLDTGVAEALPRAADDSEPYFRQVDGRWVLPEADMDGHEWRLDWPMIMISAAQADGFAAFATRTSPGRLRLPSVEEWTMAASGADGRLYPWGNRFEISCAALRDADLSARFPHPVGAFSDDCSPVGVRDLCGGVLEWTRSVAADGTRVLKGGSYRSWAKESTNARERYALPNERYAQHGFRICAGLENRLEIQRSRSLVV